VRLENAHPSPVRIDGQDQLVTHSVNGPLLQSDRVLTLPQRGAQLAFADLDRLRARRLFAGRPPFLVAR
jgi:hypothetical protein